MTDGRRGAAVLGSPIAHSLSPVLHRAAYDALGLTGWTYRAIECREHSLRTALAELDAEGLAGVSLTMPLKRAAISLVESATDAAAEVRAANTVLFGPAPGIWHADNTDIPGLVAALRPALGAVDLTRGAAVLGAGATAASAVAAIGRCGFAAVEVFARRARAAEALVSLGAAHDLSVTVRSWDEVGEARHSALLVSTVPAGASPALVDAVHQEGATGVLFDVIYSPWPTALADAWESAGGDVVGGLELLIEQAAFQVELMTGLAAPVAVMRVAGYAALERTG
ncbi:MAG TPA: shikimate dehydrogenase [Mycobacteriales bacterium]|nr:shikimate dehydrogenase [Mycobacteriales bacterium]